MISPVLHDEMNTRIHSNKTHKTYEQKAKKNVQPGERALCFSRWRRAVLAEPSGEADATVAQKAHAVRQWLRDAGESLD